MKIGGEGKHPLLNGLQGLTTGWGNTWVILPPQKALALVTFHEIFPSQALPLTEALFPQAGFKM